MNPSQSATLQQNTSHFKKFIKEVLKHHRDNIYIYKEFSVFETYFVDPKKGLATLEACLQSLPNDNSLPKIHLSKSLVELLLQDSIRSENNKVKSVMILIALSLNLPVAKVDEDKLENALEKVC